MSLIGGNIAEMETVAGRFALTGEDTLARGSEVSAFARSQQAEYDNLAHSLVNHINAKAAECRSQAQAMRSVFASTNWQGNSRVVVENAEAQLECQPEPHLGQRPSHRSGFQGQARRVRGRLRAASHLRAVHVGDVAAEVDLRAAGSRHSSSRCWF